MPVNNTSKATSAMSDYNSIYCQTYCIGLQYLLLSVPCSKVALCPCMYVHIFHAYQAPMLLFPMCMYLVCLALLCTGWVRPSLMISWRSWVQRWWLPVTGWLRSCSPRSLPDQTLLMICLLQLIHQCLQLSVPRTEWIYMCVLYRCWTDLCIFSYVIKFVLWACYRYHVIVHTWSSAHGQFSIITYQLYNTYMHAIII